MSPARDVSNCAASPAGVAPSAGAASPSGFAPPSGAAPVEVAHDGGDCVAASAGEAPPGVVSTSPARDVSVRSVPLTGSASPAGLSEAGASPAATAWPADVLLAASASTGEVCSVRGRPAWLPRDEPRRQRLLPPLHPLPLRPPRRRWIRRSRCLPCRCLPCRCLPCRCLRCRCLRWGRLRCRWQCRRRGRLWCRCCGAGACRGVARCAGACGGGVGRAATCRGAAHRVGGRGTGG